MTEQEIMQTIPQKEAVYLIFSKLTRSAYLECNPVTFEDEVFLFAEEEDAKAFVEEKEKEKIPVATGKVSKNNLFRMFVDLYPIGVNVVNISVGKEKVRVPLDHIVKRPPDEEIDSTKIIENQQLAMSLLYFLQEARKPEGIDGSKVHEMEEEMIRNLYKAQYILPIKKEQVDGKDIVRMMLISMQDKSQMIPVFSDSISFQNFVGEQTTEGIVFNFEALEKMEIPNEAAGYVLNPAGPCLAMTKEYLKNIKEAFE